MVALHDEVELCCRAFVQIVEPTVAALDQREDPLFHRSPPVDAEPAGLARPAKRTRLRSGAISHAIGRQRHAVGAAQMRTRSTDWRLRCRPRD